MDTRRSRRTIRALAVLACIAISGAGASGCTDNKGDTVAVIGDSITALDQAAVQQQLGKKFAFTISGNFGLS